MRCVICDVILQPSRKRDICHTCSTEIRNVHIDDDWQEEINRITEGYKKDDQYYSFFLTTIKFYRKTFAMSDPVNSPEHYNMLSVEAIDIIEMSMTKEEFLGYLKGNALKYMIRYKHKDNPKQDLSKANWYLKKLEEKL